jgi:type IV/VI secretion system ImpK/VasF family protein
MSNLALKELALPFFAWLCTPPTEVGHAELSAQADALDTLLRDFKHQALRHLGDADLVDTACYLMSTAGDEWFVNRIGLAWMRHSLLVRHHGDAHGGERCWQALEPLLTKDPFLLRPEENELLGLYELVIGFGLRGRYSSLPDGEERIHDLRLQLYDRLYAGQAHDLQARQLLQWATQHLDRRQRHLSGTIVGLLLAAMIVAVLLTRWELDKQWSELTARLHLVVDQLPTSSAAIKP